MDNTPHYVALLVLPVAAATGWHETIGEWQIDHYRPAKPERGEAATFAVVHLAGREHARGMAFLVAHDKDGDIFLLSVLNDGRHVSCLHPPDGLIEYEAVRERARAFVISAAQQEAAAMATRATP